MKQIIEYSDGYLEREEGTGLFALQGDTAHQVYKRLKTHAWIMAKESPHLRLVTCEGILFKRLLPKKGN